MPQFLFRLPHSRSGIGSVKWHGILQHVDGVFAVENVPRSARSAGSGVCFHETMLAHGSVMYQVDNTLLEPTYRDKKGVKYNCLTSLPIFMDFDKSLQTIGFILLQTDVIE